jgi:hypothetical protein
LDLTLRKLQIDLTGTTRQIEALERNWIQRWADEKDRLKDDRDRAWFLFSSYLFGLFALAGVLWGGLLWWVQLQRTEILQTVNQIPVLNSNIRNFIVDIEKNWPDFQSSLDNLNERTRLENIRHQIAIEYIRELAARLHKAGPTKEDLLICFDTYALELITVLHLLSGQRRYVRQAAGVLQEETELPTFARESLPTLSRIYHKLDAEMADFVDVICQKFGVKLEEK